MLQRLLMSVDIGAAHRRGDRERGCERGVGQALQKHSPLALHRFPPRPDIGQRAEILPLSDGRSRLPQPPRQPQLLGPDDVAQRSVDPAVAALPVLEVLCRGQGDQRVEHAPVSPRVELVQLPDLGDVHVGRACYCAATCSPPSNTLAATILPSITCSSPTTESRTVLPTTRTPRPTMLFAMVLSVT